MIKKITFLGLFCLFSIMPLVASASCIGGTGCNGATQDACRQLSTIGCTWAADSVNPVDQSSSCTGSNCLSNPLGNINSPQLLIGRIITSVMGVVGSLALLMFIYGGLTWMTSSGSAEKVKKGRDIILWSAVGLVVIFMSYALVRFVLSTIG